MLCTSDPLQGPIATSTYLSDDQHGPTLEFDSVGSLIIGTTEDESSTQIKSAREFLELLSLLDHGTRYLEQYDVTGASQILGLSRDATGKVLIGNRDGQFVRLTEDYFRRLLAGGQTALNLLKTGATKVVIEQLSPATAKPQPESAIA